MSFLSAHLTMAASTAGNLLIDLGRPFLKRIIVFPQADVQFRISSQGIDILPNYSRGCDLVIVPVDRLDTDVNTEIKGPPYELFIEALNNSGAGERTIRFIFEGYPTTYPVVKVAEKPGRSIDLPDKINEKSGGVNG